MQNLGPAPPRLPMPPYQVRNDILDGATLAALLDFSIANETKFQPTLLYGAKPDPGFRVSLGLRDFNPIKAILREQIRGLVPELISALRVTSFVCRGVELELVAHGDGAFFKRHIDLKTGASEVENGTRMISAVYYFHAEPKAFTGGALRLYSFGAKEGVGDFIDLEPRQNTLLAFPSWAQHEVRPVSCPSRRFSDSRFAVNCWMYG